MPFPAGGCLISRSDSSGSSVRPHFSDELERFHSESSKQLLICLLDFISPYLSSLVRVDFNAGHLSTHYIMTISSAYPPGSLEIRLGGSAQVSICSKFSKL